MAKKFFACVYGGASSKLDDKYIKQVEKLGKIIADNDFSLVYGAGASGCMGAVARGVQENDGYVMGISPYFIREFEPIFECDNTVLVDTMDERKMLMEKHADIFIIAPGGIGTMDEFFQVLTLKYLDQIKTPIIILNIDGFYDGLISFMKDMIKNKAVISEIVDYYDVVDSVDEEYFKNCFENIKNEG